MSVMAFDYDTFTTRNLGFVDETEQQLLQRSCIFVCGVGGMGGAAFMALVRAGVGRFIIADIDRFEVSNLNRQVFAFVDKVGEMKADVAAETARQINPPSRSKFWAQTGRRTCAEIARKCPIIVNGMDDIAAGVQLYRDRARRRRDRDRRLHVAPALGHAGAAGRSASRRTAWISDDGQGLARHHRRGPATGDDGARSSTS